MKTTELRKKNASELQKLLTEHEAEIRSIRFGTASGGMKNVKRARTLRKEIARIKTVVHEQN